MDIKSMAAKSDPDLLTLEDKARHGALADILTIGQIAALTATDVTELSLLMRLIQDAIREKKLFCKSPELAESRLEQHHVDDSRYDGFIGRRRGFSVLHDGSGAPIHKDDYKQWLQSCGQWPVKGCLLANWWAELKPQAETTKVIQANDNDVRYSGLLHVPSRVDGWFGAIDDMAREFVNQFNKKPNEAQAWRELSKNPPNGYRITLSTDRGEDCLRLPGCSPLNRSAFAKRWKKYTANNPK